MYVKNSTKTHGSSPVHAERKPIRPAIQKLNTDNTQIKTSITRKTPPRQIDIDQNPGLWKIRGVHRSVTDTPPLYRFLQLKPYPALGSDRLIRIKRVAKGHVKFRKRASNRRFWCRYSKKSLNKEKSPNRRCSTKKRNWYCWSERIHGTTFAVHCLENSL